MKRKLISWLLAWAFLFPIAALADVTDPLANSIGTVPVAKESIELSIAVVQNEFVEDYQTNYQTRVFEALSGCDIVPVVFSSVDASEKLKMMVVSGDRLPDIIPQEFINNDATRYLYGDAGALIPLNEYFDEETGLAGAYYQACERAGLDAKWALDMVRSPDGNIYAMPEYPIAYANTNPNRAWINQEWLDALNLKHPTTIDELTQVLIAFRDGDPNGNGLKDEIPMTGAAGITSNAYPLNWLQNLFIYSDMSENRYLPLTQTDGQVDVSYDKPEYREFLQYVNMLVREGLLSELCFTQSVSEMRAQLQAQIETVGMMFGSANGFGGNIDAWQPLEQPAGMDGERRVTTIFADFRATYAISSDCEHPEIAFLFAMQGYANNDNSMLTRFGEKGVDWIPAQEGQTSIFQEMGMPPNLQVRNMVWGVKNNKTWQGANLPAMWNANTAVEVFDGNELYGERLHGRSVSMNNKYSPDVSEIITKIVYYDEEQDRWNEVRNSLRTYVQESMARFATGQLDPSSDTDWNNYLAELDKLQYKQMLEVDNIAYRRTMGLD